MQLFDTHAHIGLIYNDPLRQISVIQQAKLAGVARIVSINNSLFDFKKEYPILKSQKGISASSHSPLTLEGRGTGIRGFSGTSVSSKTRWRC